MVAEGTAAELKQRIAEQRLDLTLSDPMAFDAAIHRLGDRATGSDRTRLTISVPTNGSSRDVRALLDELDPDRSAIDRFAVHGATLDDVFLALTGQPATTQSTDHTGTAKETANV